MKEFIEGFKEVYYGVFSLIFANKKDFGRFCAIITLCTLFFIFITFTFNICRYLGKLEVKKAHTSEITYSEVK